MLSTDEPVELVSDMAQVVFHEVLDVTLVAGLRESSLIVLAWPLLRAIGRLDQSPTLKPEDFPALAADHHDERALSATDQRDERSEVERPRDLRLVFDRIEQGHELPHIVQAVDVDGERASTVAREFVLVVLPDALETLWS